MKLLQGEMSRWYLLLFGILCFAASLVYTGYEAIGGNRAISLALVELLRDPTLYPSDPVRETLYRYVSPLWWVVAWLSRFFRLEALEFTLFLAFRALLFYAAYRLARALAPGSRLAAASALTLFALVPQPILAEGTIMIWSFEQSSTAVPFVVLAVADFVEKRYWRTAVWLGIVANLTVLYAVYTLIYLGAVTLALPDYRADYKRWITAGGLFLAVSLPVFVLIATREPVTGIDMEFWYKVNRFRSAHHLFPLAFRAPDWVLFLCSWGLVSIIAWLTRSKHPVSSRLCVASIVANVVALLAAFVFAYAVKSTFGLVAQFAKAVDLFVVPIGVVTACASAQLLEDVLRTGNRALWFFYAALWVISINLWSYMLHPKVVLFHIVISAVVLGLYALPERATDRWFRKPSTVFALIVILGLVVATSMARQWQTVGLRIRFTASTPVRQLALWAQRNTPKDAVFLIPPGDDHHWPDFRALSRRGVFVTWKDGTNILFDPRYTREWVDRIAEIGFDIRTQKLGLRGRSPIDGTNIDMLYEKLNDRDVQRIARRYRVDYWVVPAGKQSTFPEVFRHDGWKVLRVTVPVNSTTPTSHPSRESQR